MEGDTLPAGCRRSGRLEAGAPRYCVATSAAWNDWKGTLVADLARAAQHHVGDGVGADVFAGKSFRQHLSVYDGVMTAAGEGVTTRVIAWHAKDVFAIEVDDRRKQPAPIHVDLRMLRYANEYLRGTHNDLAREHGLELVPEPATEEETARLVRHAEAARRLRWTEGMIRGRLARARERAALHRQSLAAGVDPIEAGHAEQDFSARHRLLNALPNFEGLGSALRRHWLFVPRQLLRLEPARDARHHMGNTGTAQRFLEVRADTALEITRLAHIQYLALFVDVPVHARQIRQIRQIGF